MIYQPASDNVRAARQTCHELEYLLLGDWRQLLMRLRETQLLQTAFFLDMGGEA